MHWLPWGPQAQSNLCWRQDLWLGDPEAEGLAVQGVEGSQVRLAAEEGELGPGWPSWHEPREAASPEAALIQS